ncbi:MAG: DUF2490 domain-containing protein [Alphaproteobacteria bacterium]|nr:DUF2490 domain-containing protein [Alphaproteobacteria bacterium]
MKTTIIFKTLILILFVSMSQLSISQYVDVPNRLFEGVSKWVGHYGTHPFNPNSKWNFVNAEEFRSSLAYPISLAVFVGETGLNYQFAKNNSTSLTYLYIRVNDVEESKANLHRIVYQIFDNHKFGTRVNFYHRIRLEKELVPDIKLFNFQYLLGVFIPINDIVPKKNTFSFNINNDYFYSLNNQKFVSNWFYVGIGYFLNPNLRLEFGWRYIKNGDNNNDNVYCSTFGVINTLPFTSKSPPKKNQ